MVLYKLEEELVEKKCANCEAINHLLQSVAYIPGTFKWDMTVKCANCGKYLHVKEDKGVIV